MSNGTGQTPDLSLGDAALVSAFAKLFKLRVTPRIGEKADTVKGPLLAAYADPDSGIKSVDVKVGGVAVATHTVIVSKDSYEVADEDAFTAFAEERGEVEVIIRARPAFRNGMLSRAVHDKATGTVVHKDTGEVIPGLRCIPGGVPTGSFTTTWKEGGQALLEEAYTSGQLHGVLNGVPMLPAPQRP
ncbi:hypothetical protein [Streptomyces sp. NPDC091278]|uniref:hypothetical protein n=1 Tax=Streptomyces sp. NPDC091278 TaxID=3155301 RepID=UPI00344BD06F